MTIKEHLKRHMSLYIMATNAMVAIATAAFAIIGVFSGSLTTPVLVGNAAVFGIIWAVGKFGNETLEDMEQYDLRHASFDVTVPTAPVLEKTNV